jgi:hypothetical protein
MNLEDSAGRMWREALELVKHSQTERKLYTRIKETQISGNDKVGTKFIAEEGYFQIMLAEMFIRDRREYWKSFLPFVLMVAEFVFDGNTCTVPFLAGNELLKSIENYIKGEAVDYRNTTMLGPTPYSGGKLSVFVGLFRTKSDDLAGHLLSLVNEVGRIFQVGELSRYLEIASPLGRGITNLLGIKDVELRVGVRDVFEEGGPSEPASSYFALVNCPAGKFTSDQFWVRDGQLWIGDVQPRMHFEDDDYCLVKYAFSSEREFSTLSFSKLWKVIKAMVWDDQPAKAEALFLELGRQLSLSPDITPSHRFNLIRLYKANLEREIENFDQTRFPSRSQQSVSRGGSNRVGGKVAIQLIQEELLRANAPLSLRQSFTDVSGHWEDIMKPYSNGRDVELTDEVLKVQLNALRASETRPGDPRELMNVLTHSAMRAHSH